MAITPRAKVGTPRLAESHFVGAWVSRWSGRKAWMWTLHHESDGKHARHGPLVARDSLDASLLDAMAAGEPLELGVEVVAIAELVFSDDVFVDDVDGGGGGGGGDG
jgi:hypothetical protein